MKVIQGMHTDRKRRYVTISTLLLRISFQELHGIAYRIDRIEDNKEHILNQ